jgi:6-phosphogluconolactonase
MVLLGMGDDGHTASLFPGSPALDEKNRLAVAAEGPPPHRERVTMTLPALANARNVVFLVSGAGKAGRVAEVLAQVRGEAPVTLPAARVRPESGKLTWLVDGAAAAHSRMRH